MTREVSVRASHRCPRMAEHMRGLESLPVPCEDCYSLLVTAVEVAYRPDRTLTDLEGAVFRAECGDFVAIDLVDWDGQPMVLLEEVDK